MSEHTNWGIATNAFMLLLYWFIMGRLHSIETRLREQQCWLESVAKDIYETIERRKP